MIFSPKRNVSPFAEWESSQADARLKLSKRSVRETESKTFEMLDLLEQLVDKSLITVEADEAGNPRYTMIETVWHYSREKLDKSSEAADGP